MRNRGMQTTRLGGRGRSWNRSCGCSSRYKGTSRGTHTDVLGKLPALWAGVCPDALAVDGPEAGAGAGPGAGAGAGAGVSEEEGAVPGVGPAASASWGAEARPSK